MGNIVFNQAAKFLSKRRNTRRWIAAVLCLALVVTSGTFGMLTRHGSALSGEKVLDCVFEEHVHTDGCYNEAGELVCGYADFCVHQHDEETCYDSEGNLVCQLPEIEAHVHDESCYSEVQKLVCELEEKEGHQHTEDCQGLVCGDLACELEEHTHGEECYEAVTEDAEASESEESAESEAPAEDEGAPESEAPAGSEGTPGSEAPAGSEGTPGSEAPAGSEGTPESEAPAGSEGTPESEAPAGSEGAPESEAPAGSEAPVRDQTPVEESAPAQESVQDNEAASQSQETTPDSAAPQSEAPAENDASAQSEGINECAETGKLVCELEEHTHENECYEQVEGLACGMEEGEGAHTHDEECYETVQEAACGKLELHTHSEECYTDGELTCGKPELVEHVHTEECFKDAPVMELTAQVDNVTITVSAAEEGIIPAGAELSVTPVVKTETEILENLESEEEKAAAEALNTVYDEIRQGLDVSVQDDETKEVKHFLAYDIGFYTENENNETEEVSLNGQVNVKMEFTQDTLPEEITADEDVQIDSVDVFDMKDTGEGRTAEVRQDAVVDTVKDADTDAETMPIQDTQVKTVETTLTEGSTIAIAWIGEINPETGEYVYEDDDVIITVSALTEGAIPENAKLQVIPVVASEETGEQYQQVAEKLLEQAESKEYEIAGFLAYDISFIDEEGNKIEPEGEVKVAMNYKEAKIPAEVDAAVYAYDAEGETSEDGTAAEPELNVKVMHLEEDSQGSVNVVDMAEENKVTTLETTEEQKIQNAEFVTGGFSVFTITWTWDTSKPYVYEDDDVKITITAIDKDAIPEGTSLAITPIKADDAETAQEYQEVARKLMEKAAGENYSIKGFLAYDISLIGEDGVEIEPDGKVKVTMEYKQPMAVVEIDPETYALVNQDSDDTEKEVPEGQAASEAEAGESSDAVDEVQIDGTSEALQEEDSTADENTGFAVDSIEEDSKLPEAEGTDNGEKAVETEPTETSSNGVTMTIEPKPIVTVMHLEEDADGEVTQVVDLQDENDVKTVETTETQEVQKVEFVTESFSTFTMTWLIGTDQPVVKSVTFCDNVTGEEIELSSDYSSSFNASNYEQGITPKELVEKDGYSRLTVGNKEYLFVEMRVVDGEGNPKDAGDKVKKLNIYNDFDNGPYFAFQTDDDRWNDGCWYPGTKGGLDPDIHFYFMYREIEALSTVPTVDHTTDGITMRLIKHVYVDEVGGRHDTVAGGEAKPGANGLMGTTMENALGTGATDREVSKNLVKPNLKDGYPELSVSGHSLAELFEGGKEVNHLFPSNNNGYYEYDSTQNYACLNEDGNFKLYNALGTPYETPDQNPAYRQGNFFPYDDINSECTLVEYPDTELEKPLYLIPNPSYFFGMYMEASFIQPVGGMVKQGNTETPMVYEFNGDDDLWVFIDDVLVLDLGGIHYNCAGSIDFATGQITINGSSDGKIKDKFREAVKAAGKTWDESKDRLFNEQGTFADYTGHTLKMFYMERGAGASTLHIKMNIPPIPKDTVQVTKQLKSSDPKYANVDFQFQLYAQKLKEGKTDEYETDKNGNEVYEKITTNATVANNTSGEGEALTFDSNGVFTLKPGQTASFKDLAYDRKYYVKELGVEAERYQDIIVNGSSYTAYDNNKQDNVIGGAENEDGKITLSTTKETVGNRKYVVFTNDCSESNSQPLFVKKVMAGATDNTEPFKMKIWMEETKTEKLQPYSGDYYLFKETEGGAKHYYKYEEQDGKLTLVDKGQEMTVCGTTTDGIVMIPAGYTVETGKVVAGTGYAVEELNLDPQLYGTPDIEQTVGDSYSESEESEKPTDQDGKIKAIGRIKLGDGATVQVTNIPVGQYQWEIVKKSTSSEALAVKGAKFTLTSVPADGSTAVTYIGESDSAGKIVWSKEKEAGQSEVVDSKDIPKGTYTLQETNAPAGYIISEETWTIELSNTDIKITKLLGPNNTQNVEVNPTETSEDGKKLTYTFYNTPAYALPSTGGKGIYWYSIGGTLLMMAGALILYRNKSKKVRGCRRA
nr:SpaA isopeptide-forming pilin-related protein [uncultured Acetatifactor sp.]